MTPLPDAARYFVALPEHAHKAYTETELRQLFETRSIKRDTLIAPVNTRDWKRLGEVFADFTTAQPKPATPAVTGGGDTPTIAHFVSPGPSAPDGVTFPVSQNQSGGVVPLFGILAAILLIVGSVSGVATRGSTFVITPGGFMLFAAAGFCVLIATMVGLAEAAAARQEAILAALNKLVAQQRDTEVAQPGTETGKTVTD